MRISYSALETFENCPLKFKLQEIDKIKIPKSKEAIFGTLIHNSLKMLHEPSRLPPPTEEELLQFFSQNWDSSPFASPTEEMAYFHQGVKILKDYYAENHPSKFKIIDLETRFEVPLINSQEMHLMTGKIDRIDKLEDGQFEIIDYKTAKKMPSQKIIDENLQLSIYHLGAVNRWPSLEKQSVKLSLYFLKHGEKLSTFRTIEHLNETKKEIIKIVDKIKKCLNNEKFEPQPNALCDWCGFQPHCPFFQHRYRNNQSPAINSQQIKNLVDEYLELKIKSDELVKKITEIKGLINNYCDQESLERLFGEKGYITRLSQKRFSYDFELVRQILEPIGKWPEVITINLNKLKKAAKELPPEIRKKIEEAKKVEKEFKVLSVKFIKVNPSTPLRAGTPPAPIQES